MLIDHEAAMIVTDIFLWFTQGKRLGEIAKILNGKQIDTPATYLGKKGYKVARKGNNIWYSTTVKAILKEKAYIGTIVNHKTEVAVISTKKAKIIPPEERIECENQHEAIISKEIFTRSEILLKEHVFRKKQTSVYKGYKQDKIEMRGDRAEMSDFPLYLNTVAGGLDRRDQTIGGFSFVVKIYAVPVVEIIG